MADMQDSQFLDDPQFQALLIACLEKLERGELLDRHELAQQFPEFAEALEEFLENRDVLEQAVGKLPSSSPGRSSFGSSDPFGNTIASGSESHRFVPGDHVRYIGQYEILEEIARGGMGIVFKVRQQGLRRIVALKVILAGRLANAADVQRFRREAQVAAQLQHPNIVAVHEVGEYERYHYFTMDFVEGQTLANQLRDESLPPSRAAEIVQTVAQAIHYAHQRGTLHRDLKPANVLLDAKGQPHVTDFGLAKLTTVDDQGMSDLTATGQVLGTPSYMSPEQAAGKQSLVGPASDIFALGATLYACLTGRAPFVADTPLDTLLQVLHKDPISPRLLNPRVPRDLETICLKCLEKEPHKRYGTAGQLTDDLRRFLEGRPVLARPIGPVDATWRWCRRNPLGAVVVLLMLFFAIAGPVVAVRETLLRKQAADSARRAIEAGQREVEARRDVQQRLYNSEINVVQRAYEMADVDRMQEILQRHIAKPTEQDQRTFEWHYWWQRCHDESRILDHPERVTAVRFSPDGRAVATGCVDGLVRLWSADNGQPAGVLKGHAEGYVRVAFTPDGSSLVTSGGDGVINVWDTEQLTLRRSWPSDDRYSMSLSPDGSKLATGGMKGGVTIWDVASGEQRDFLEVKDVVIVGSLAFSPDGTRLAVGGDRDDARPPTFHLEVWDLRTREKTIPPQPPAASMATATAFSPDGEQLVIGESPQLVFYETSNYDFQSVASGHAELVDALAYAPDGRTLASGGHDRCVRLWDTRQKRLKRTLIGHRDGIIDAAFSPDGDTLATASFDNTVRLWKVNNPTMDQQVELKSQLVSIPLSPSRGSLIAASEAWGNTLTWTSSREPLSLKIGEACPVGISQHGWLAVQDRTDTPPHAETASYQLRLIDFLHGRPEIILGESRQMHAPCAFAPDGSVLATVSGHAVQLRSLPSGKPIADAQVHEQPIVSLIFSADRRYLLSSGTEPSIKIWDRKAARLHATISGYTSEAPAIAINPDCTVLASAHLDGAIRLWNGDTAELIATLTGHSHPVRGVAFSPDGQTLASIGDDGALCLWDPAMHELRTTLRAYAPSDSGQLVWTPDGRTLAVDCDHDNKLQIWQAALEAGDRSN